MLYRDQHIVAVSKPPGMLVHRARPDDGAPVLLQTLKAQIGCYLYPVHRLDRATSGIVAFALSSPDAARLQRSLADATCRKDYLALVRSPPPARFASLRPLTDDSGSPQPCHTGFRTLRRLWGCAVVRARLHTGRRHRIRRHLAHLALHVLGDTSYGKGRLNRWLRDEHGLRRMFLHATRLCFTHPVTGARVRLRDPLPEDLRAVLRSLPDAQPRRRR